MDEEQASRRYQSGQPTVFSGAYIIVLAVLQCVYTWRILQLCGIPVRLAPSGTQFRRGWHKTAWEPRSLQLQREMHALAMKNADLRAENTNLHAHWHAKQEECAQLASDVGMMQIELRKLTTCDVCAAAKKQACLRGGLRCLRTSLASASEILACLPEGRGILKNPIRGCTDIYQGAYEYNNVNT